MAGRAGRYVFLLLASCTKPLPTVCGVPYVKTMRVYNERHVFGRKFKKNEINLENADDRNELDEQLWCEIGNNRWQFKPN